MFNITVTDYPANQKFENHTDVLVNQDYPPFPLFQTIDLTELGAKIHGLLHLLKRYPIEGNLTMHISQGKFTVDGSITVYSNKARMAFESIWIAIRRAADDLYEYPTGGFWFKFSFKQRIVFM